MYTLRERADQPSGQECTCAKNDPEVQVNNRHRRSSISFAVLVRRRHSSRSSSSASSSFVVIATAARARTPAAALCRTDYIMDTRGQHFSSEIQVARDKGSLGRLGQARRLLRFARQNSQRGRRRARRRFAGGNTLVRAKMAYPVFPGWHGDVFTCALLFLRHHRRARAGALRDGIKH